MWSTLSRFSLIAACCCSLLAASGCSETPLGVGSGDAGDAVDSGGGGCPFSGSCALTPENPCAQGELGCAADGTQTCTAKNLANGTSCGTNQVCKDGVCGACKSGEACTDPANPCKMGVLDCSSGTPTCTNLTASPDGTSCGTGQVCSAGSCTACVQGGSCTDAANSCLTGTQDCTTGPKCNNLQPANNGTSCGQNMACLNSVCTCQPGAPCTSATDACQIGTVTCTANAPSCGNLHTAANGASCGQNQACLSGQCKCQPGGSCTIAGSPCKVGKIDCTSGSPQCVDSGAAVANGTACGTDMVCSAGACVSCKAGGDCIYGVCLLGSYSCATGQQTCSSPHAAANGTVCDPGGAKVCTTGQCLNCQGGQACHPGNNQCKVGVTDCSGGAPATCANVVNAPDGTNCGNNMFCQTGQCRTCVSNAACHPNGDLCKQGTLSCNGGMTCNFTQNSADGTWCGQQQACTGGVCTCNNTCTTSGQASCNANNSASTVCTQDPATGCLSLTTTQCGQGKICSGGACVCNNTCPAEGVTQCASQFTVQMCTKNAGGCLSWQPVPATQCPNNVGCSNSACSCPAPGANDLYVNGNPNAGSDLFGNGSQQCPFASITKGLAAASGRTGAQVVHVARLWNGSYGVATTETFPLLVASNTTLRGDAPVGGQLMTSVRGDGSVATNLRATVQANGGAVENLNLRPQTSDQADTTAVYCNAGSPSLTLIQATRYADALTFTGSCTPTVTQATLTTNGQGGGTAAIVITGAASASVTLSNIVGNRTDGILVDSTSMTPTVLTANGDLANLTSDGVTQNSGHGVHCRGSSALQMQSTKVWANGLNGVFVEGSCAANISGADAQGGCGLHNSLACNYQQNNNLFNVETTSTVKVQADHNSWEVQPPGPNEYQAAPPASIDVTNSCAVGRIPC